jgi:uncharacterized coiled-coil protein SlyX
MQSPPKGTAMNEKVYEGPQCGAAHDEEAVGRLVSEWKLAAKEKASDAMRLAELERRVSEQDSELAKLRGEVRAMQSPLITGAKAEEALRKIQAKDLRAASPVRIIW